MTKYFAVIFLTLSVAATGDPEVAEYLCRDLKPAESLAVKATLKGEISHLKALLKCVNPNTRTYNDLTLLHVATYFNQIKSVKLLLQQRGIRVEAKSGEYFDATPLQLAASLGRREIAEMLVRNGAKLTSKNNYGKTAHQIAIEAFNDQCTDDPTASQNPDDYSAIIQLTQETIN